MDNEIFNKKIDDTNDAFKNLNNAVVKFYSLLTSILLVFLGLTFGLKSNEDQQELSFYLFWAMIFLLVLCLLCSITVLYGEIKILRDLYHLCRNSLLQYYQSQGKEDVPLNVAEYHKIFEWAQVAALVFLVLSLICLVIYIYIR